MRITNEVCEAIDEYLFQRFGDKVYNLDAKLLHHGATLRLITTSKNESENMEQINTYELEIRLMDREIRRYYDIK